MRQKQSHMAVVVNEFGGTSGVITLDDILGAVVEEIREEDDSDSTSIMQDDGTFDGQADMELVRQQLGLSEDIGQGLSSLGCNTLNGFLCFRAGEIPNIGEQFFVDHIVFEVLERDPRKLLRIRATNSSEAVAHEHR